MTFFYEIDCGVAYAAWPGSRVGRTWSAVASLGFFEWADIASIGVWSAGSQRALCLRLKDPDKYARAIGPIKRTMLKLNHKASPGEVALATMLLAAHFEQLEALVINHLSAVHRSEQQQRSEPVSDEI